MKQKMIDISSIKVAAPDFLNSISKLIEQYPEIDIVNFKDITDKNQSFLHKLSYTIIPSYVAYFLEKGANIYILDDDKLNSLHCAAECAAISIRDDKRKSNVSHSYQIARSLLHYEAEQRAYFPEKYKDISWLKDQFDYRGRTPLIRAERFDKSPTKEVVQELKKALKEQEVYYQECLEAKAKGIVLTPYHKKFLPEIIKSTSIAEEKQEKTWKDKTWSEKILEGQNSSLRHRSKSDEPLQTKQEAAMKSISRSSDALTKPETEPLLGHKINQEPDFVTKIMGWFVGNTTSDKVKGL
ncbi:hypothetical protein NOVO_01270 [Rickettsiales bacterium Ac37b]|nr:hypothetical protein NOVO_01270 [Rickettsiales bacterium Ac37b]